MSSESASSGAYGTPTTSGPKPLLSYQGAMNAVMRGMLRTPGISQGIGSKLLTIVVVGRKSGKTYTIPLGYLRHEGKLLVATRSWPWLKNLRPGEPAQVRIKGRIRQADWELLTDEENVVELFDIISRASRPVASFNGVGFDPDGTPNRADLHQAWEQGCTVLRLSLR
jgi:deazaflavin-dependent oxidoreductase (nitroreductase family)